MPSEKGLILSIKEPGSDKHVLKSGDPKDVVDQDLIAQLRQMVSHGAAVPELVRLIQRQYTLAWNSFLVPILYLTQAFGIGINEAKGICSDVDPFSRASIYEAVNRSVMPYIQANQQEWDQAPVTDAKQLYKPET